jgi:hypothetical protein
MQDMQDAHYHHRPIAGCELELAEDIMLPGRRAARGRARRDALHQRLSTQIPSSA